MTSRSKELTYAVVAGAMTLLMVSCSSSALSGKPAAKADSAVVSVAAPASSPSGGESTTTPSTLDSSSAAAKKSGVNSCTSGCCPSKKVAFVDCSGDSAAKIKPGSFDVTAVSCKDTESSPQALDAYDTIYFYGPPDVNFDANLPPAVSARLKAGAKVIAQLSSGAFLDHSFFSLTIEQNIEFLSNIGGSSIAKVHPNTMTKGFNQSSYSQANLNYMMFLGPFLLVNPFDFDKQQEADWCTDMTARSVIGIQNTTFHGYMRAHGDRKGVLITSTLSQPNASTGFDFSDPFLAAQLSQTWNASGDSAQCGLDCGRNTAPADRPAGGGGGINIPGLISSGSDFTTATGIAKPVIYLYPKATQDITVKLDFSGKLVTTYPQYNSDVGGWRVQATPQGQIFDLKDKQEYSYIYWNGTSEAFRPSFASGFVVPGKDVRHFLQEKLSYLGLSPREANDMIVYWLPYMERHPYNLVHFAQEEYTSIAKLAITPKPDALLRVFLVFKGVPAPLAIPEQKLERFQRHGFTAVEWGGAEIGSGEHVIQ